MNYLRKYLKPYRAALLLCVLLLIVQAVSNLYLPNMMSSIVDNGIRQNGVTETLPTELSADALRLVATFMKPEQAAEFKAVYKQNDRRTFELDQTISAERKQMQERRFGQACYAFAAMMKDIMAKRGATSGQDFLRKGFSDVKMNEIYPMVLPLLGKTPPGVLDRYRLEAEKADPLICQEMARPIIQLFYQELGVDLKARQNAYLLQRGLLMLLITLLSVAAAIGVGFMASRIGTGVAKTLRHDVFSTVIHYSCSEYDRFSSASLITRASNDVIQIQLFIAIGIRLLIYAPIMGAGGVVMALRSSVSLSWIIAVAVLVLLGFMFVVFRIATPRFESLQKLVDRINLIGRENLNGLMVVRAFNNEAHEETRFDRGNRELTRTNLFIQRLMSLLFPLMMFLMNSVALVILWNGSHAIDLAQMRVGDMIAFLQYAMMIIMAFLMLGMIFVFMPRALVSAKRVGELLSVSAEEKTESAVPSDDKSCVRIDGKEERPLAESAQGSADLRLSEGSQVMSASAAADTGKNEAVKFQDVTFAYPNADLPVIEHVSFTARPGETTAIIGSTGSGKSTLVNLLPRFYEVTDGAIHLGERNIRDLDRRELRGRIAYIPQKAFLFSGDIASNLRLAKADASEAEIEEALRVAQAWDFVSGMDEGIHSAIAEGGDNVSGGQRQRLAIARAVVKKAPIYIFDDSFSALDYATDAALRRSLAAALHGAVVLIVAQRVSTIMHAEQIIVLDSGKMVGRGTHTELLESCPAYYEIASSQLAPEELYHA